MRYLINRIGRYALALMLSLAIWPAQAAIEAYEFRDEAAKEKFHLLTEELRCPKCQNQNLADSNAPIAKDMREKIHEMVQEGASTQSVVEFMVARYGDFVNYRPRRDSSTAVLWYGPIVLLAVGGLVVVLVSRRRRARGSKVENETAVDQERLNKLLSDDEKG